MPILLFFVTVALLAMTRMPEGVIYSTPVPVPKLSGTMQVIVSVAILACALAIILSSKYGPQDKHWAYGSAGTILGFWLKSSK
jgi:hypothetical protein